MHHIFCNFLGGYDQLDPGQRGGHHQVIVRRRPTLSSDKAPMV